MTVGSEKYGREGQICERERANQVSGNTSQESQEREVGDQQGIIGG